MTSNNSLLTGHTYTIVFLLFDMHCDWIWGVWRYQTGTHLFFFFGLDHIRLNLFGDIYPSRLLSLSS